MHIVCADISSGMLVSLLSMPLCVLSPAITTEDDGTLRFTSGGDLVFEAGDGGQVQFMTANGPIDTIGQKVRKGGRVWSC